MSSTCWSSTSCSTERKLTTCPQLSQSVDRKNAGCGKRACTHARTHTHTCVCVFISATTHAHTHAHTTPTPHPPPRGVRETSVTSAAQTPSPSADTHLDVALIEHVDVVLEVDVGDVVTNHTQEDRRVQIRFHKHVRVVYPSLLLRQLVQKACHQMRAASACEPPSGTGEGGVRQTRPKPSGTRARQARGLAGASQQACVLEFRQRSITLA